MACLLGLFIICKNIHFLKEMYIGLIITQTFCVGATEAQTTWGIFIRKEQQKEKKLNMAKDRMCPGIFQLNLCVRSCVQRNVQQRNQIECETVRFYFSLR